MSPPAGGVMRGNVLPAVVVLIALSAGPLSGGEKGADYLRQVKPLLVQRCVICHGPLRQESGLRLDAAQFVRAGGALGAAVVPGDPDGSPIIQAVTGANGLTRMPKEGKPLTRGEIELLRRWIAQGAVAPDEEEVVADPARHWAFERPVRPELPEAGAGWGRNAIDAFLAAAHEEKGLTPVGEAPRHILLRRVYLDLIGLPPTREQLREFLADDSPGAYERVVDKLLESPHYGERWGRHWMDVWRYSDWYGYRAELRNSAKHIWRWRDWIVESLNTDKPYDRIILEMLAADELAPTDREALRGTGFLARNYYKFNRNVWMEETVEHTSKAFLGITMNCARCHDHMYDPISQKEYYQFRAFFEPYQVRTDRIPGQPDVNQDGLPRVYDADLEQPTYLFVRGDDKSPDKKNPLGAALPAVFADQPLEIDAVELPAEAYYPGLQAFVREEALAAARGKAEAERASVAEAQQALARGSDNIDEAKAVLEVARKRLDAADRELEALAVRIAADDAQYARPGSSHARELGFAAYRSEWGARLATAVAEKGHWDAEVRRLQAAKPDDQKGKAALNKAKSSLAAAEKRLAEARSKLEQPSENYTRLTDVYPATSSGRRLALAQWIADEGNPLTARVAVNQIWMRHFGEPLVPTVFDFGMNGQPPTHPELLDWLSVEFMENGWSMKHLHRLIVTSTAYRMHSAAAAEHPNAAIDPDNHNLWRMSSRRMESEIVRDSTLHVAGTLDLTLGGPELDAEKGQTTYRRSLYYRHAPEKFMTFLTIFDAPNTDECYRRNETVVPQQALALANSPLAVDQARRLAARLTDEAGPSPEDASLFVDALFELVLCRAPNEEERRRCLEFLDGQTGLLASAGGLTKIADGPKGTVAASQEPHLRARENLVHVLLNHNEFVTIR